MYVELKDINKTFGDYKASDHVSFGIEKGKLIGLLGPSGSGKKMCIRDSLKSIRDILLDLFDGGFPGGFIAGAEAHDQNCPVCLLIHKNVLLFYIFRVCSDYTIAPQKVQFFSRKLLTFLRKSNNILNISKRYVNKTGIHHIKKGGKHHVKHL